MSILSCRKSWESVYSFHHRIFWRGAFKIWPLKGPISNFLMILVFLVVYPVNIGFPATLADSSRWIHRHRLTKKFDAAVIHGDLQQIVDD